jgi:hypothetical protein
VWTGVVRMASRRTLLKPIGWRKPGLIFVNSMSDVFHPSLKASEIAQIFAVMALGNQHVYQVLTKRPDIMHALVTCPATPISIELAMQAIRPGSKLPAWPYYVSVAIPAATGGWRALLPDWHTSCGWVRQFRHHVRRAS